MRRWFCVIGNKHRASATFLNRSRVVIQEEEGDMGVVTKFLGVVCWAALIHAASASYDVDADDFDLCDVPCFFYVIGPNFCGSVLCDAMAEQDETRGAFCHGSCVDALLGRELTECLWASGMAKHQILKIQLEILSAAKNCSPIKQARTLLSSSSDVPVNVRELISRLGILVPENSPPGDADMDEVTDEEGDLAKSPSRR
ncbi:hypothetical protein BSKO_08244 [Bryopsis sp. KO-2023]|nr:hypothetical protein BSKO_08244 [Bryopsis sp. KO-2023]